MAKVAAKAKDRPVKKKQTAGMRILTILFSIVSVFHAHIDVQKRISTTPPIVMKKLHTIDFQNG